MYVTILPRILNLKRRNAAHILFLSSLTMATRRALTLLLHKNKWTTSLLLKKQVGAATYTQSKRAYTTFSSPRQLPAVPEPTSNT